MKFSAFDDLRLILNYFSFNSVFIPVIEIANSYWLKMQDVVVGKYSSTKISLSTSDKTISAMSKSIEQNEQDNANLITR